MYHIYTPPITLVWSLNRVFIYQIVSWILS